MTIPFYCVDIPYYRVDIPYYCVDIYSYKSCHRRSFMQLLELTSCGVDVSGLLLIDDDDDGDDEASEGTTTGGRDDDDYNYMFLGDIAEELNELTRIGVFNYGECQD